MTIPGWPHQARLACPPESGGGRPYDPTGNKAVRAAIAAVAEADPLDAVNAWRWSYYRHRDSLPQWGMDWRDAADQRNLLDAGRELLGSLTASSVLPIDLYGAVLAGTLDTDAPDGRGDAVLRCAWGVARLIRQRAGAYMTDLYLTLDARYAGGWQRWGTGGRPCGACGGTEPAGCKSWCTRPGMVTRYTATLDRGRP